MPVLECVIVRALFPATDGDSACALFPATDGDSACVCFVQTRRITGQVHQLVQGDEGFEHPSDEHCNVFTLDLVKQTPEQLNIERRLIHAENVRVRAIEAWSLKVENSEAPPGAAEESMLAKLSFIDAIDHAARMSEDLYGSFRQQITILDEVKFSSMQHRDKEFARLRECGVSCARAHQRFDTIAQTIQLLIKAYCLCLPKDLRCALHPPLPSPFLACCTIRCGFGYSWPHAQYMLTRTFGEGPRASADLFPVLNTTPHTWQKAAGANMQLDCVLGSSLIVKAEC